MSAPRSRPPRVAVGSDHGGFDLKEKLRRFLAEELGVSVLDCGTDSTDPVDYPDLAAAVARKVAREEADRGIVVDGAGIGSAIAANKLPGIRAAVCHDERSARNSREHNDANVLCLGAAHVAIGPARRLVRIWLDTPFGGGRHARRIEKIRALEAGRKAGAW